MVAFCDGNMSIEINAEGTYAIYQQMESNTGKDSAMINYVSNIERRGAQLEPFFARYGIDLKKVQGLYIETINSQRQMITYSGYYPIICSNEEKVLWRIKQEECSKSLETEHGFELSLDEWEDHPAIFFTVEFPWLFMPPICSDHYQNRTKLPVIVEEYQQ